MWSFETFDRGISNQISEMYKKLQRIRVILTIFIFITIIFCFPVSGDYRDFLVLLHSFQKGGIFYNIVIAPICILSTFYFCLLMIHIIFVIVFTLIDLTSYVLMIREKLRLITTTYDENEKLIYCGTYQSYVNKIMVECIHQHVLLLRWVMNKFEHTFSMRNIHIWIHCNFNSRMIYDFVIPENLDIVFENDSSRWWKTIFQKLFHWKKFTWIFKSLHPLNRPNQKMTKKSFYLRNSWWI